MTTLERFIARINNAKSTHDMLRHFRRFVKNHNIPTKRRGGNHVSICCLMKMAAFHIHGAHLERSLAPINRFSHTERAIMHYMGKGFTAKEIAINLDCSPNTIKYHTKNLYTKLEVNSNTEAILKYQEAYLDVA